MNVILQSSLSNIAIILFMHLCLSLIVDNKRKMPKWTFYVALISIISASVIFLFYLPIRYGGYQFDLRLIPLVFTALRWGWKCAIPTLLITMMWRLGMGGPGAVPGVIFGMFLPVVHALIINQNKRAMPSLLSIFYLIIVSWLLSDLPIISLVPDGLNVFKEIAVFRIMALLITALILYMFVYNNEKEIMLKNKLQYYAERDPLTGLYNMRLFQSKIKSLSYEKKNKYIVMIDIDHFKLINDTFGHLNGDSILRDVAATLKQIVANKSNVPTILGRYGGEEFILLVEADTTDVLMKVVDEIRSVIEKATYYTEDKKQELQLTVSIGVSMLQDSPQLTKAIEQADNSLYASKKNGRNQISYANNL